MIWMTEEKPGMAQDSKELVSKAGAWIGLAIVAWSVVLVMFAVTFKILEWLA